MKHVFITSSSERKRENLGISIAWPSLCPVYYNEMLNVFYFAAFKIVKLSPLKPNSITNHISRSKTSNFIYTGRIHSAGQFCARSCKMRFKQNKHGKMAMGTGWGRGWGRERVTGMGNVTTDSRRDLATIAAM